MIKNYTVTEINRNWLIKVYGLDSETYTELVNARMIH